MPHPNPADESLRSLIAESARSNEPDRYLTALLSPAIVRDDLITLAAYLGEVRRIALTVSEDTLGEIRLQWWRDTLSAGAQGGRSGNPIADEMVRVIARHDLPMNLVMATLEAASFELQGTGPDPENQSDAQWLGYLDQAEAAGMRLSLRILGADQMPVGGIAAGRAYATIRLALRLPELVAQNRWPVPWGMEKSGDPRHRPEGEARAIMTVTTGLLCAEALAYLKVARTGLGEATQGIRLAILPTALTASYAKALQRPGRDALRQPAQIAPLTRILRLWGASKSGRI